MKESNKQFSRVLLTMVLILLPFTTMMAQNVQVQRQRKSATPTQKPVRQRSRDAILRELIDNMVYVEGGTFQMGSTTSDYSDEKPVHTVTVLSFYIGKTEVTQEQWQTVMGNNPSEFKDAKRPVERVSWDDCQEFITKLNTLTGKRFRLLTEAEWEFAARGGNQSQGYIYSGSNTIDDVAWYGSNSGSTTHNVGMKAPNELGLYDMAGNVWEWCQDWHDYSYYDHSPQANPTGPSSGAYRVCRGGGWSLGIEYCRVAYRGSDAPTFKGSDLGLRLAQ